MNCEIKSETPQPWQATEAERLREVIRELQRENAELVEEIERLAEDLAFKEG